MAADPREGKILHGRYKLLSVLAEGGMGIVYRAERVGIGRPVVVKFLHTVLSERPGIVDRFEREARATARLNHPNCVGLVDFGIEEGAPFLVMEYVEGRTLADLLDHGALPARRAAKIARQVLAGLSHAHERGILHRDLKPANVMIVDTVGWTDLVKVLDFGLAKLFGADPGDGREVTVQGIAIGTPGYMSPEQAAGVPSDRRSDVYCVGALLYHLVTGAKAFSGSDVHEVLRRHREETPAPVRGVQPQAKISDALEDVIARAMERDPQKRYQNADEMAQAIRETPEGIDEDTMWPQRPLPDLTKPDGPPQPPRARRRSGSGRSLLVGAVIGFGIAAVLALYTPVGDWLARGGRPDAKAAPSLTGAPPVRKEGAVPSRRTAQPASPPETPANAPPSPPSSPPLAARGGASTSAPPSGLYGTPPIVWGVPPPGGGPQIVPSAPRPDLAAAEAHTDTPARTDAPGRATARAAPDAGADEDDQSPRGDDGESEDPRSPPPVAPAAPHREGSPVRSLADVRQLLRKGDTDGALAGLYHLRQQKQPPARASEIARVIGHIYFDRKWWTDALREYRFAIALDSRAKSDPVLIGNAVHTLADHNTYSRASRLLLKYVGRPAIPALRKLARTAPTPLLRRRAESVLAGLGSKTPGRRGR